MAKYTVKHTCGCEHTYNLFGKHTDRDRTITWLEGQVCPSCKRAAEEEAAKEITEGMELPELEGSPKQIAWANTIRAKFIDTIRDRSEMHRGQKKFQLYFAKWIEEEAALEIITTRRKAATFINWRNEGPAALIAEILYQRELEEAAEQRAAAKNEKA